MSERVRFVMEIDASDYDGAVEWVKETAAMMEEHLPGTLVWEASGSTQSGKIVIVGVQADADASSAQEEMMGSSGLREKGMGVITGFKTTVLTPIQDPRVADHAERAGALLLQPIAGVNRLG